MPTPSLILVPARFKTGKLYTPVATTSGGVVLGASGDFNVTRATTATRVNASGLIESVASGIPRLDYYTSGGTAGCPALLVEPSGSNIALRSNALNTAPNVLDATTFSGNIFVSPDGTQNAARFTETTAVSPHGFYQYQTIASGAYTTSVFTKQTGRRYIVFNSDFTGAGSLSYFDLQTKSVLTNGSGHTGSVQVYGDGWLRLIVTIGASVSGSRFVSWGGSPSGTTSSYGGDVNISQTFYGLQIEAGSVATSYIPTTAAAVTRNADVISLSGAVSGCIGQTEGTLYAEVDVRTFTNGNRIVCLSDGTSDNRIILQEGANSTLQAIVTNATSGVVDISTASGRTAGIYKIAIGYKQNDFAVYVNGSQTGTDNTGGVPACNQIFIGKIETTATTNQFNDRIRAVALYTTRLTDSQLQALTT